MESIVRHKKEQVSDTSEHDSAPDRTLGPPSRAQRLLCLGGRALDRLLCAALVGLAVAPELTRERA